MTTVNVTSDSIMLRRKSNTIIMMTIDYTL